MGRGYSHRCSAHNRQVRITFVLPMLMILLLFEKQNKVFYSVSVGKISNNSVDALHKIFQKFFGVAWAQNHSNLGPHDTGNDFFL